MIVFIGSSLIDQVLVQEFVNGINLHVEQIYWLDESKVLGMIE